VLAALCSSAAATALVSGVSFPLKMAAMAAMASAPKGFPASLAWVTVRANTDATVPLEYMRCSNVSISRRRRVSSMSYSSSSPTPISLSASSSSSSSSSYLRMMLSWAPPASLNLLDTSSNDSSEAFQARTGVSVLTVTNQPTGILGIVAPNASFAAFPPLWVFFQMA